MVAVNMTTSPVNALQTVNNLTIVNGIPLFGVTILAFVWIIVYARAKGSYGTPETIAAASFFTSIICIFFAFMGLVPDSFTGIAIAIAVLSIVKLMTK